MNTMNDVEVIINNKRYTLSGYESGDYLQKIASYINTKYTEFKLMDSYNKLDVDMRNILMQINIADDYFKAISQVQEMNEEADMKGNELFDLKHEVIAAKTKLESVQKDYEKLQNEYNEAQKTIIKLQTELEDKNKK
ncbi:cell division protein ZapA [Anaerosporobacter faecicola]|uniref:cell division protein ZapA n=1 Tax=Anaerosporobacter faecicola TaxID=2718714 RepID=UPI00143A2BCD|nr:cell division protein ZapA [Anaerosporobacter faecicola]